MDGFALGLALAGGSLTLFAFFAATWKLFRFIFKVDAALPVILDIAHEFQNNSGSTLKDKIDKLDENLKYQQTENRLAVRLSEDSRLIANTNAAIVNELSKAQSDDVRHIKDYLHEQVHEMKSDLNAVTARINAMMPYVVRHRETDDL